MRECPKCRVFFLSGMRCSHCHGDLEDVTLDQALEHTRKRFIRRYVQGKNIRHIDRHMQYIFANYLGDPSMAMIHWINRNLLKYGREYDRFLVRPLNPSDFFNLPWLIFNLLDSNLFHAHYNRYCPECDCKHMAGKHTSEQCAYNQMFLNILKDVLSGEIAATKKVYEIKAAEDLSQHRRNAFLDLQPKRRIVHFLLDFFSVGVSVLLWMFIAVSVLLPVITFLLKKADLYNPLAL